MLHPAAMVIALELTTFVRRDHHPVGHLSPVPTSLGAGLLLLSPAGGAHPATVCRCRLLARSESFPRGDPAQTWEAASLHFLSPPAAGANPAEEPGVQVLQPLAHGPVSRPGSEPAVVSPSLPRFAGGRGGFVLTPAWTPSETRTDLTTTTMDQVRVEQFGGGGEEVPSGTRKSEG